MITGKSAFELEETGLSENKRYTISQENISKSDDNTLTLTFEKVILNEGVEI